VLFKLFFAKEYPTNKTLNTANKSFYEKLPKFEQHFGLVSRIDKLNLLTRNQPTKTTWK
jgi:hypothetical protein